MVPRILNFGERHIKYHPKQMERERRENEGVRGREGGNYGEEGGERGQILPFFPSPPLSLRSVLHTAAELILPSVVVLPISPSSLSSHGRRRRSAAANSQTTITRMKEAKAAFGLIRLTHGPRARPDARGLGGGQRLCSLAIKEGQRCGISRAEKYFLIFACNARPQLSVHVQISL